MAIETYKDGYIKSDVVLSIGMLVSNHIQYIDKCMEGLKPLLGNTKSELIILDTVGPEKSDGSIDVCRKYTDKIYRFEWRNDFSSARNELLKYAQGEWFMYQDDDEWFDDVSELIEFFNSNDRYNYGFGYYRVKNYTASGPAWAKTGRMIRRKPDTHMIGRIHETFNEVIGPGKQFSCYIHHWGYMFVTEEEHKKKVSRNLTILDEEIKEFGIDPIRCTQKVQELLNLPELYDKGFELAVSYCDKLIEMGYDCMSCIQWMISAQARYYLLENDWKGVVSQIKTIRNKYKLSKYTKLVLADVEVDAIKKILTENEYTDLLEKDAKDYIEFSDYYDKHPEEEARDAWLDYQSYRTQDNYNNMLLTAAQVCNKKHKYDEAYVYWKRVDWTKLGNPYVYKEALCLTLRNLDSFEPLKNYYFQFMNPDIFNKGNEKYIPHDLGIKMGAYGKYDEVPISLDPERQIDFFENLPIDVFVEEIKKYTEKTVKRGVGVFDEPVLSALLKKYENNPGAEYYALLSIMAEREIQKVSEGGVNGIALDGIMTEYVNAERKYFEILYRSSSFRIETIHWLPKECLFNDILYRFIKNGKKDYRMIVEAAKNRPDMAKALSVWIGALAN